MKNEWTPEVGQKYQHHSGRVYEVTGFANQATEYPDKFPVTVIYKNVDNGTEWARALDDWRQKFRPLKSEADKLREEQIDLIQKLVVNYSDGFLGLDGTASKSIAEGLHLNDCRMTRELTDDVILEIGGRECNSFNFAKAIAAYVRGEEI